jgi:hypothetical protein
MPLICALMYNIGKDFGALQDEFPKAHADLTDAVSGLFQALTHLIKSRREFDEKDARFFMDMNARKTATAAIKLLLQTARNEAEVVLSPVLDVTFFTAQMHHFDNQGLCVCVCVCVL